MIEKTLAKRYAAALLKVTDAEGSTEETESFLLALKDAYLSQKEFRAVLAQPRVPRAMKKRLLVKIFEGKSTKSFTDLTPSPGATTSTCVPIPIWVTPAKSLTES